MYHSQAILREYKSILPELGRIAIQIPWRSPTRKLWHRHHCTKNYAHFQNLPFLPHSDEIILMRLRIMTPENQEKIAMSCARCHATETALVVRTEHLCRCVQWRSSN